VAIFISLLMVACPAYLHYNELIEIDFLSSSPVLENLDLSNLATDKQSKIKIFGFLSSSAICLLALAWIEHSSHLSFQVFSLHQSNTLLRC